MSLEDGNSQRICLTGSSGFVGGALAPYLAEKGFEVVCVERFVSNRYNTPTNRNIKTVFADLTDHPAIQRVIKQLKPEYIIHLAALSPVAPSYDRYTEFLEVNFNATVNLAESAMRDDCNLKQFVVAGTSECYGNQKEFPIKETAQYYPNSPYAVSKVAMVHYLQYMWDAYQFPVTIMFPFNSYGRANCKHFITEKIIWQMLTKRHICLGDPTPIRDLLFVTDHIEGYASVLGKKEALGEKFNICTGTGVSIKELTEKIRKFTGFDGEVVWGTVPSRPLDIDCLIGDNMKAQKVLNWSPKVSLDEGLERTVELLKKEVK